MNFIRIPRGGFSTLTLPLSPKREEKEKVSGRKLADLPTGLPQAREEYLPFFTF
jgi:hypothetical protein